MIFVLQSHGGKWMRNGQIDESFDINWGGFSQIFTFSTKKFCHLNFFYHLIKD